MNIVSPNVHFYFILTRYFLMMHDLDSETQVEELKDLVKAFVDERDWEQFHSPKNLSMAIAAEAAELMEHFLWQEGKESMEVLNEPEKRAKIAEELADILIFSLEFANICKLDISTIIHEKMIANARKYPVDKAKGRSDKYTEL